MDSRQVGRLVRAIAIACCTVSCSWRGDLVSSREQTDGTLRARIRLFTMKPVIVLANYQATLEVAAAGSERWREITAWDSDDPVNVQVKFVTDRLVYAFATSKFVVTTNAGHDWSIWDAWQETPQLNFTKIEEVQIASDGTGRMVLRYPVDKRDGFAQLRTQAYGRQWAIE